MPSLSVSMKCGQFEICHVVASGARSALGADAAAVPPPPPLQAASRPPVVTTPAANGRPAQQLGACQPTRLAPRNEVVQRSSKNGQASIRAPSRPGLQSVAFCSGRVRPYGRVVRRVAYLFVIGSGRCGSTLVHRVLAGHPDVGWISAADDRLRGFDPKGRLNRRLWLAPGRDDARLGARTLPAERGVPAAGRPRVADPRDALPRPDRGGRRRRGSASGSARFFEERAAAQGTPVFLHKFTGWPRAGLVHAVLPEARFLHVVRDGRAVANSLLQMPWWHGFGGPEAWTFGDLPDGVPSRVGRVGPVVRRARRSRVEDPDGRRRQGSRGGARCAVARGAVRGSGRASRASGSCGSSSSSACPGTTGSAWRTRRTTSGRGRSDAYRQELRPEDVKRLDQVLGGHLERLGYPVAG